MIEQILIKYTLCTSLSKYLLNGVYLIVNNLKRLNNKTQIILGDKEFDENVIKEKYLLREHDQIFTFPITFDESKITSPHLETNYLNDYKTEQHMLINKINTNKPLLLVFMSAHVQGDVICQDYKSKIAEIKENIIHPGDKVNITGIKLFEAPLEVKDVEVLTLNQIPVKDLVYKSMLKEHNTIQFKNTKIFSKIQIKNPSIIGKELQASYLNNLRLEDLLNNDYYMDSLYVPYKVETTNIVFHKINGIPFEEIFTKLDVKDERLILHKDLIVEGNIQFEENLEVVNINDIPWDAYVNNLVLKNEDAIIEGEVRFSSNLTITKEFEAPDINSSDLKVVLKNILMKSKPQLVTGSYQFVYMNASNMDVLFINNMNVSNFVDLSKNLTEIEGDLILENLNIEGNLQGYLNEYENLLHATEKVKGLNSKSWRNLYALNNAHWPTSVKDNGQHRLLKYFHKSAVKSNQDQIITGNVKISKPIIAKMQTRFKFPTNLDLDFIYQDGLLRYSSKTQNIKGDKVFLKTLYMENMQAKHYLNSMFLNKIDILRFNQSLYRLTNQQPLQGPLKFLRPITISHLHASGLINGLNTSCIFQLTNNASVPALKLHELHVENDLEIKNINDMSLEYFLVNRLTLNGPALEHFGILQFEHLIIEKDSLLQSINIIPIDNLVFKHSPYLQTITGHKTLENLWNWQVRLI